MKEAVIAQHLKGEKLPEGGEFNLSLQINPTGFMYAVSDATGGQIYEICRDKYSDAGKGGALSDQVAMVISNHRLTSHNYRKIYVSITDPVFTIIPESYATGETVPSFVRFATGSAEGKRTIRNNLAGMVLCYAAEQDLLAVIEKNFSNAVIRHSGAVAISLLQSHPALRNADIFMQVSAGTMEITARQKKNIVYYNVFSIENDEDALYYLIFMMQQFGFDPAVINLMLAGELAVNDSLVTTISKYIRRTGFCVTDKSVRLTGQLTGIPHHFYFALLNQHLCGS